MNVGVLSVLLLLSCWGLIFDAPFVAAQDNDSNNDSNNDNNWSDTNNDGSITTEDFVPAEFPDLTSPPTEPDFSVAAQFDDVTSVPVEDAPVDAPTVDAPTEDAPTDPETAAPPADAPTPASECPLTCVNGAECKLGEHDYSDHPREPGNGTPFTFLKTTSRQGWFCDCTDGYTGLRCNREYEKCPVSLDTRMGRNDDGTNNDTDTNNDNSAIENHYCYHGGQCVDGLTDGSHGNIDDSQRFCDCSKASHNGTPYYGKYCEIEGAVRCGEDSQVFCAAQGTCKEDFETLAHPCDCIAGHRGAHCEFLLGSVPNCSLTCGGTTIFEDGVVDNPVTGGVGKCILGVRDFATSRYQDFWSAHDGNYQYCVSTSLCHILCTQ